VILPTSPDTTSLRCQDCGRSWILPTTASLVDVISNDAADENE
jgi:hypothetical protein